MTESSQRKRNAMAPSKAPLPCPAWRTTGAVEHAQPSSGSASGNHGYGLPLDWRGVRNAFQPPLVLRVVSATGAKAGRLTGGSPFTPGRPELHLLLLGRSSGHLAAPRNPFIEL